MSHFVFPNLQRGIALIVVLLFLQIIAMLVLYSLSVSILSEKVNAESWQRESTLLSLEALLHAIAIKLQDDMPHCMITQADSLNILAKSIDWWQSSISCAGYFQEWQYYYVVEPLGEDPCAQFAGMDRNQLSAYYFRIMLLAVIKHTHMKIFIQSTLVKPFNRVTQCNGVSHIVNLGEQGWHEL